MFLAPVRVPPPAAAAAASLLVGCCWGACRGVVSLGHDDVAVCVLVALSSLEKKQKKPKTTKVKAAIKGKKPQKPLKKKRKHAQAPAPRHGGGRGGRLPPGLWMALALRP